MSSPGVVIHINEGSASKQEAVLRNIKNLIREMPELPVELVVQGDAISIALMEANPYREEVARLQDQGLVVSVCHNTMRAKHVGEADLLPRSLVVPSAMSRLVAQQQSGFAYIKP